MEEKKRTGSVVAVTVVKSAVMYVEAETPEEALKYAREYCDEVDDSEFWDSDIEVDSCGEYPTDVEDYMKEIWVEGGKTLSYDEYMDELEELEEEP